MDENPNLEAEKIAMAFRRKEIATATALGTKKSARKSVKQPSN
jgi:hypothetical protein